ncbi:MAG: alcohol dehydrogenase catalytic domain-containing protein [Chloroflexi bacterium]|nr:alcohol dehydrogenase catalytic domain-containing protein [Chloroflexota bacterium]
MKAIVFHGTRNILAEELPIPRPGKGELLLRPMAAGICFSDKLIYESDRPYYRKGIIIGHEGCGEVAEIGEGVTGWQMGERVVVDPFIYCGQCLACLMGQHAICEERLARRLGRTLGANALRAEDGSLYHGLLAEYCTVPAQNCYRLPENVDVVAGASVEPMAQALHAVRQASMAVGDNVVIMGLEDYNAAAIKLLPPLVNCVVVEPVQVRQALAKRLGADRVLDPTKVEVRQEMRKLMPFGADVVLVSVEDYIEPSLQYPDWAHEIVRSGGTIVMMRFYLKGNIGDRAGVQYSYAKGVTLKLPGAFSEDTTRGGRARSDYQTVIDGMATGRLNGTSHVSMVIPFQSICSKADIDDLFGMLPEKETKIVISMENKQRQRP